MADRLSFRGLKCPECDYPLEGLNEPVCPECGIRFNPDVLYSADYVHSFQWTRRRRVAAWALGALITAAVITAAFVSGGGAVCMLIAVCGLAGIFLARRLLVQS